MLAWGPLGRGLPEERGPFVGTDGAASWPRGAGAGWGFTSAPALLGPPRGGRVPRGVDALGPAAQAAPGKWRLGAVAGRGRKDERCGGHTPFYSPGRGLGPSGEPVRSACSMLERGGQTRF